MWGQSVSCAVKRVFILAWGRFWVGPIPMYLLFILFESAVVGGLFLLFKVVEFLWVPLMVALVGTLVFSWEAVRVAVNQSFPANMGWFYWL